MSVDPLSYFIHAYDRDLQAVKSSPAPNAEESETSFADFLDIINPLQHIPVVSSVYRAVTGDEISPEAKLAGSALYCGAFGIAGVFNLFSNFITGKSVTDHAGEITKLAITNETTENYPQIAKVKTEPVEVQNLPPLNSVLIANEVEAKTSIWLRT